MSKSCKIYLILDAEVNTNEEILELACLSIKNQLPYIQIRDKLGRARDTLSLIRRIKKVVQGSQTKLIVNDRIDLALLSGADGVHLGQDDISIGEARSLLGEERIIGASCQTLSQAINATQEGADYIGFGSVFKTLTKPERDEMDLTLLKEVVESVSIPVYAIGGISLNNIDALVERGVNCFAVCRSVCKSSNPEKTIKALQDLKIKPSLEINAA